MRAVVLVVIGLVGCEESGGPYGPPPVPIHDVNQEGHLHARGHETPYLCLSVDSLRRERCPDEEPELHRLSCDSSGCHGTFDYRQADATRALTGDAAPSCWECHGREWNRRMQ